MSNAKPRAIGALILFIGWGPAIPGHASAVEAIHDICGNNGKTRNWAQIMVAGDLADETRELDVAPGTTRIAVLDTGFDDSAENRTRIVSPRLTLERGFGKAGDPRRDEDGHGTMVAGVIGGAASLGVAPHAELTVYRVTEGGANGSTTTDILAEATRAACRDGHQIINISWGGVTDEAGFEREEVSQKDLIEELAREGCLVMKSAGNASYRKHYPTNNPDDSLLRVAATGPVGTLADFSSAGEVAAPGSGIFTLRSLEAKKPADNDTCGGEHGRFVSGTSFSAPITAAVAGRLHGILVRDPSGPYAKLAPAERVTLLTRMLRASERGGSVNVLRGGLIARGWIRRGVADVPRVEALALLLSPPSFCAAAGERCADLASPAARRQCVERARRALTLCDSLSQRKERLLDLIETYRASGNLEPALYWFRVLYREFFADELTIQTVTERLWQAVPQSQRKVDFEIASEVLPLYVRTRRSTESAAAEDAVFQTLSGSSLESKLSKRRERGSEEDLVRVEVILNELLSIHGRQSLERVLSRWVSAIGEPGLSQFASYLAGFRTLDHVISGDLFTSIRSFAASEERRLLEKLQSRIVSVPTLAEEKPAALVLAYFSDLHNLELDYLDGVANRNATELRRRAIVGIERGDFSSLGAAFLLYLILDEDLLQVEERARLAVAALRAVAKRAGWGANDRRITQELLPALRSFEKSLPASAWNAIAREFADLLKGNTDLSLFSVVLPFVLGDKAQSWDIENLASDPLFDFPEVQRQASRLVAGIAQQSADAFGAHALDFAFCLERALPWAVVPPGESASGTRFPAFPLAKGTRLSPPQGQATQLTLIGGSLSGTLETILDRAMDFLRAKPGLFHERPLTALLDNEEVARTISPSGAWRAKLTALVSHMETNQAAYGAHVVSKVKQSANTFLGHAER